MEFDFSVVAFGLPILLRGLGNTVLFCAIALPAGLLVGSAVALMRLSRQWIARAPAAAFVEIIRDTPFLVQAFLLFYGLPTFGIRLNAATAGIIVLTIHSGAYFAEGIRGAILSVPKGQLEAARALGMPYLRGMRRIVFPQMMGYLLPALTNQIIGAIKDSAVLSVITAPELSMAAQMVLGESFSPVETYAMVALIYWGLIASVSAGLMRLEKRVFRATTPAAAVPRPDTPRLRPLGALETTAL
jgi:His/Glu/Gln/Arg/opine family amino acid ABC transporter permease subunit